MADRTISYLFRGDFRNFQAGLTAAGRGVQDFGGRLTALDRDGERMRRGLSKIGDGAGKVGLAAAAGLGAIVLATANFDKAMSRVSAATNASTSDLNDLRKAAIKAGADTVFSASEAADGITELGKAGLTTKDILGGGLTGALNLAAAGQISVADAANTTATTLQQFSLGGDQASRVADVLSASAGKAMGDVTDMAEAFKYVGPVAAQMGLSLEDTAGVIAELAQQGILGSQAGTSLRGMLTALTSPSKLAAKTMTGLGISMYDTQGKFVGFDGVAGQLQSTLGGLTDQQRDVALGNIFGNEQITAARILYAGGADDVQKWTAAVTDSGYAAEQAATLTDNLSGDIEQLKGSLETAFIGTGESSQGPLRALTQNLTDVVNGYSALPGPAKSATGAALGLTAALGGGTFLFAKAIGGLASLQNSMIQMGTSADRASRLTRGIGRVGGAVVGLGLLSAGLASTNKGLAGLEGAAGGAIAGFAVGGPWGAAIGGATGLVLALGKSHGASAAEVNALTATLDAQTGALTENSREWAIKQLGDSGALDTAHALGINLATVTDAALGNADAIKQVSAAVDEYKAANSGDDGSDKAARGVAESLNSTISDTGGVLARSREQWKQHAEAMGQNATEAGDTADAMTGLAGAAATAGDATFQTAQQVDDTAKALDEARKAAESTAQGFFGLGDSLNDSKVSLDGWIDNLNKQAEALANFRKNAKDAAENGLRKGLIQALKDAGPEGAMRLSQLADASDAQIGRANKAWKRGQNQIESYVNETAKVPPIVTTNVTANAAPAKSVLTDVRGKVTDLGKMVARVLVDANTNPALGKIAAIRRELSTIPDESVNVNVRRVNAGGFGPQAVSANAAGGYIRGPGTATSDSIPAALSNGEYVVKTKAVSRYGVAMMDAINQERFATGGLVGFADGGKSSDKGAAKARARARARKGLAGLDVDLTVNAEGASDALAKFSSDLDNVRGLFKDAHLAWTKSLKEQAKALTASARQFDSLNATLTQARSDQAAFAAQVGSSVSTASLTGGGLDGFNAGLSANTNDTNDAASALSTAVANGLDGALYDFLATSGDSSLVGQFGGLDASQIQQEENAYNAMLAAQASFGGQAGNVKYASQIASLEKTQKDLKDAINQMVNKLPDKVYAGARDGSHDGSKSGTSQADSTRNTQTTQNKQAAGRGGGHRRGR